jgi:DNA-binding NarL/FixJ family response regulator
MNNKQRVVLIDDHTLVRAGLRALIDDLPNYTVVGEGSSGAQALPLAQECRADVLVMDISMPGLSGIEALSLVRAQLPRLPVIMLSMHDTREYVRGALRAGASAYLLKEAAENELELALNTVLQGQQYLSPQVAGAVLDSPLQSDSALAEAPLTVRQREVLRLLALGRGTKEIAFELELSAKTIESHRAQIMERLSIRDVAGLVIYAIQRGIIRLDERSAIPTGK